MKPWTFEDIPDQTGRTAIVTGANTGIGSRRRGCSPCSGATVVLACRNAEKGEAALARIAAEKPAGTATSRRSISRISSRWPPSPDASPPRTTGSICSINNAGVMVPPLRPHQAGLRAAVRHQPPRPLRAHGAPLAAARAHAGRAHRRGVELGAGLRPHRLRRSQLGAPLATARGSAYSQSKLANMMFALELQRRLAARGSKVLVTAAHPGWTATDLQRTAPARALLQPAVRHEARRRRDADAARGDRSRAPSRAATGGRQGPVRA